MTIVCVGLGIFERKKIMKLELKHLAPYLPYGLKIHWKTSKKTSIVMMKPSNILDVEIYTTNFKPILRPIEDLTKEIERNGRKYSLDSIIFPKDEYSDDFTRKVAIEELKLSNAIHHITTPYSIVEVLLKHHFDVFGLIEQGLAININTVD